MNSETYLVARLGVLLALIMTPALTGCALYHVVNDEDALYCEKQGFKPGTDQNVDCALKRHEEQEDAGVKYPAPDDAALRPMPVQPPPPPGHAGGPIPQVTPITAPIGMSSAVNFTVSVNPDCSVNGLPTVQITKKPKHGFVQVIERTDYARFSQVRLLPSCGTKKIPGMVVVYTPARNYYGDDSLEFETVTKTGVDTVYKVPITVEKLPPQKPIGY